MSKKLVALSLILIFILSINIIFVTSCAGSAKKELILASTTSTADSGLFDAMLPEFEKISGYKVKLIAVGTGEAISMGEKGDADVLMVHSRAAEDQFMEEGYGSLRKDVMHNDFVIVGPAQDPAQIKGKSAPEALKAIAESQSLFISRADKSGTNNKEISIWEKAGITPTGEWYMETGQGMGATLTITQDKQAYTITDRGTWLAMADDFTLEILVEGDSTLFNPYGVIAVNPEKFPDVNNEGALAFIEYVTGEKGQALIKDFGVDKYGQPLFYPDVIK
jgi:tungstate transport system substrate-binding protein